MSEHSPDGGVQARAEARRERLREVIDRLEGVLAQPAAGDLAVWRANVAIVCDALDEVLDHHVHETEDELFTELEGVAPHVAPRIARLRSDHPRLLTELAGLRMSLTRPLPTEEAVATTRELGLELIADLLRHRHAGADLLYEAYWVDIATAD